MRARNLKPSLFKNEALGSADPLFTLVFEGLWCAADREGRLEDRPLRIHAEVNPYRDPHGTISALAWLEETGFIVRYEAEAGRFIQIINFHKHQNPHQREAESELPPPHGRLNRYSDSPIGSAQRKRIIDRDGACKKCGATDDLHVDHIVPRSVGGTSLDDNLQVLCRDCNLKKGCKEDPRNGLGTALAVLGREKAVSGPADSPFPLPDSPFPLPDCACPVPGSARAKSKRGGKKPKTPDEPLQFAAIRAAYPKRAGTQRWPEAVANCRGLVETGAATWDVLLAAAERYARFCDATGKTGTETTMQAASFYGKNQCWREDYAPPVAASRQRPMTAEEAEAMEASRAAS